MNNILTHKGYIGSVNVSIEDNCLHGKVEFINDLVTYEADTPEELETAFIEAVEDYLETCAELGEKPDKPFKGTFNIRIGSDLHRRAAIKAKQEDISLNQFIYNAVEKSLESEKGSTPIHFHHHEHKYIAEFSSWITEPENGVDKWEAEPLKH